MALVRPFHALRPTPAAAPAVASVPYDVVTTDEARALAADNPLSFLRVSRAEIDLDSEVGVYDEAVYRHAAAQLETLKTAAPLVVEDDPTLYLYRLRQGDHEQVGVAGCFSLDEYDRGDVRRHELTRPDKEDDRTRHMLALGAQTGVVFLTYRASAEVDAVTTHAVRTDPLFDFTAADGVQHTVWRLSSRDVATLVAAFGEVPRLYIADGHHRIASAARARRELAPANRDDDQAEACFFLGVAFPDRQTRILAYNRTVQSLAGLTPSGFVDAVQARFPVHTGGSPVPPRGRLAMYLEGRWYDVDLRHGAAPGAGVADTLDVARLQHEILAPVLQVADVRTDPRMRFVGGARGTEALERAVDAGEAAVAFSLAAVTPEELLAVSDADEMMPPKSTWFEPKLRDGLLIHLI